MNTESNSKTWNVFGFTVRSSTIKRYFAMLNICLLGLGTFVCFDSVGALQNALMEKFDINFKDFSLMYSVNSWGNIIISPFGGFLIDRVFGIRIGTIFYVLLFLIGHLVFSLGVTIVTFWCALFGRFINGVGHEFIYIAMQLYSVHYFKGKEISMIMCTNVSIARLGTSLVYSISEPLLIYIRNVAPGTADVGIALFIVGSFITLTVVGGIVLLIMTPKTEVNKQKSSSENSNIASCEKQKVQFRDIFILPFEFWLLIFIQISFVVSIYVFLPFTQKLFETSNGLTISEANDVASFFNIVGVVMAPIIGIFVDKYGREIYVIQVGFITGLIAHLIIGIGIYSWTPYLSMFILSLSYGLFNGSVLPMMAILIPEYKLGTAYGVACTFGNAGYAVSVYLVGFAIDQFGYLGLSVFMLVVVGAGGLISVYLFFVDKKNHGILNITSTARRAIIEKEKERIREATESLKTQNELNCTTNQSYGGEFKMTSP